MIRFLIFMKKEEYEFYNVSKMSGSTPFRSFFSYGKLMSAKAQAVQLSNRSAILLTVFLKHFFTVFLFNFNFQATKMLLGEPQDDSFAFSMSRDEELQKLGGYDLSK